MSTLYPLTHPQKRIWYVEKTFPGTGVSNIAATVRIKEQINFPALKMAINHIVRVNEAMRTRIVEHSPSPMQYFAPYEEFEVDFFDFSGKPMQALYDWDTKLSLKPLPFIDSPLFYFAMFKLNDKEGGYFCNLHHIITDAWTEMLLYAQVMNAYRAYCEGREPDMRPAPAYSEYITREQKYLASERIKNDENYWLTQFTPVPDLVTLQTKKPSKKSLAAYRKTFVLSYEEAETIRTYCREKGITVFSFFLTMLTIYINRITGSADIVLGTPVLNRVNAREKSIFGMFISTIPLRFCIDESSSFIDYARNINTSWLSILRHQQYPFDLLLHEIRNKHSNIGNLFEITLSYQNAKTSKDIQQWDGATRWHFSGYQNEPLVIHINDRDDDGLFIINYDYNLSCFADKEIDFIHSHFKSLVADAIKNPDKPIKGLSVIGSEELQRIQAFNNTAVDFNRYLLFAERFIEQAKKLPDEEAVIFHDTSVTYGELDAETNRLGRYLRKSGVKQDDLVAVMLPRGIGIITSMLGVLKAGGAFLPVDPSYPKNRIDYMLKNSSAKFIITTAELAKRHSIAWDLVITLDDPGLKATSRDSLDLINKPQDLIYVMYTSGSTGLPKGVMVKHAGVNAFIHAIEKLMYFAPKEAVLSLSTIAFDIFICEVFPALVHGMKIVLADETEQRIPLLQKELIKKHGIVKFLGTPSRMQLLLDDPNNNDCFSSLKEVMLAGEVFPEALLKRIKEVMSVRILNGYGPTETTMGVSFKDLTDTNVINIGRPIANSKIYILDKNMNFVPIGIPGELYIGGEGLARGYLNNPELTESKFIPNPFAPGELLYRTGDLGRWYPKGEIAFLGRIDSQVKIRGLRIELEEIENVIRKSSFVSDVVVLDIDDRDKKTLCAYIVPQPNINFDLQVLRKELSKTLPRFMIPSFFIMIDSIPLNSSGKVNRRALPAPDKALVVRQNYRPPADYYEQELIRIWEEILGITDLGGEDDFLDLGGDSLDVVSLITAIQSAFQVEMTIDDIYNYTVLHNQAARIRECAVKRDFSQLPSIIPLHRGYVSKNIFFVHAGSGEVSNYFQLSRLLPADMNYFGIRYIAEEKTEPYRTVPQLAAQYLKQVREMQPHGPYLLAGWCIGGTIAFEMARQLEEKGESLAGLIMINTICPRKWEGYQEAEQALLKELLPPQDKNLAQQITVDNELWNVVMEKILSGQIPEEIVRAQLPPDFQETIPNYCEADTKTIVKYLRIIRSLHYARSTYYPSFSLQTGMYFIKAAINDVIKDQQSNLAGWQQYCSLPIQHQTVDGGHFSVFTAPYVNDLAKVFRQFLLKMSF